MTTILLIKFILCSGLFYGFYNIVLEKDSYHSFKRFFLIASFIAAAIIPLFEIQLPVHDDEQTPYPITYIQEALSAQATPVTTLLSQPIEKTPINYWLIFYMIISAIFLFRFIKNIASLCLLIIKNDTTVVNGTRYVLMNQPISPFSFLQYIFVNKEQFEKKGIEKEIIDHEIAHISQKHSWDNIFFELIACFVWVNPFVFLYTKAIKLNHEFLADRAVVEQNKNASTYLQLLLSKSIQSTSIQLTSSFNFLIIKKRITMITQKTSPGNSLLRRIAILPVAFFALYIFSTKAIAQQNAAPPEVNQTSQNKSETQKHTFFSIVKPGTGATDKEIEQYNAIIKKIKKDDSNVYDWKNMDRNDGKKLQSIFSKMNIEQRKQLEGWVSATFGPSAPAIPTENQLESFKNASVYGVWVDGKKITNSQLNNYKASDFRHYSISKLYGAAKKGRNYTHQLNLMTIPYYEKYRKETIEENEKQPIVVIAPDEKLKNRKSAVQLIKY